MLKGGISLKEPVMELARAYIKIQEYGRKYSPEEGLEKGTIFPDLLRPYDSKVKRDSSAVWKGGRDRG